MLKFFTKNLDTMEKAGKNGLNELHEISALSKDDMKNYLGGSHKEDTKSKNKKSFFSWLKGSPNPCNIETPL